ncbi:40S ribosomal protein S15 (nucleomorph) [Lotharella oceanica]|uniref:40S ribosomal protein S15 n=1 Tax=Lotharella oceanica TaxID=641309 RepID=A0A060DG84_9EUKA|nr:40S ribosomal protein S15 [Lotharella oceanica]|mmetsp:Transcript_19435/g.36596  ORF Transcript_19435/g.36596 Transcript_19435/m.36596 type:complete len:141 (+) Transcript_19435:76-498(+)
MTLRNFKGKTFKKLINFKIMELYNLLDSRRKRKISRYAGRLISKKPRRLSELDFLDKFKNIIKTRNNNKPLKTHIRNLLVFPVFVNKKFFIYSGKSFIKIDIKIDMIGRYFGEYSPTYSKVQHGAPGIGASHSSRFVPLK